MKKELAALVARAEGDERDTSHNAIGRLLKLVEEEEMIADGEARSRLYALLSSRRPAVVSSVCQGLARLLESEGGVDLTEVSDELVKALETAVAQEKQRRQQQGEAGRQGQERGAAQSLTRCLVTAYRVGARREAKGAGERGRGEGNGVTATLLSMEKGVLYPALSYETTCFLGRFDVTPREVVRVVGPLASALLLQPEYANFRSGFLLKLSTASVASSDAVKLCLVLLQTELLGFSAVHTAAHADVAATWCCSLVNTTLSLESDAAWRKASRALAGVVIFLLAEFREHGAPITPLLASLHSMVAADALCLADEATFLGITALQTHCVYEREALLDIVCRTLSAVPPLHPQALRDSEPRHGDAGPRARAWSLEALVYPTVSMAAAGNAAAVRVLPLLQAALGEDRPEPKSPKGVGTTGEGDRRSAGVEPLRYSSVVALGVRRLSGSDDDQHAMVAACRGLERRAGELRGAAGGGTAEAAKLVAAAAAAAAEEDLECGLCLLSPLLLRPQEQAHAAACAALVAVVRAIPALGLRLLPFVLYAVRKLGGVRTEGRSVACLLGVLPELGAHKVAAKPVAGVIQALAKAPQAAVRGLGLRLAAALVRVNSRTFNQLQSLLSEVPADHAPPLSPEPDESRLCRVAGMLEICEVDPELGLECVRPLQAFLGDSSGAVAALALKAIAALCRGDCLDFDAALRIVTKKGKVAHTGLGDGETFGDPRVMEGMAQLCGAGAEALTMAAAEAEEEDSEDSGDGGGPRWGMSKALKILLRDSLGCHPDGAVRAAVYAALGEHLPALLRAATGKDAEEDAVAAAPQIGEFLGRAMSTDESAAARSSLEKAAGIVLVEESVEPSTWAPSKRASAGRDASAKGSERSGPSNRLLGALPAPNEVLQAIRQDDSSCAGLAGALLWSYPAPTAGASATAHRDAMIRDLGELMAVEGTGGGLALCPWQRAATPVGIQRYVARMLAACLAAEAAEASGRGQAVGGADVTAAAVEACRTAIENLPGVQGGLVAVASASLASCVPASFSHLAVAETGRAVKRLRGLDRGAQGLLDGEEIFPLCAAIAVRALPESSAELLEDTLAEIEHFHSAVGGQRPKGDSASAVGEMPAPNEAQCFWSSVAVGVASEWGLRHPTAPAARTTVLRAVRRLLAGLASAVGSDHLSALAETWFRVGDGGTARADRAAVAEWESIGVGQASGRGGSEMGVPSTVQGSRCFGLFLGLSSTLPGLRATGLHVELLQPCVCLHLLRAHALPTKKKVFNIARALALKPEAGLCGATLCLAAASSECLSCGLLDAPVLLACLRSVSLNLDGPAQQQQPAASRKAPAQDTCLGAAGLVAACEGKVVLPAGFVESMFEGLRGAAAPRRGADSGVRVASMFALATVVGCPLLTAGEQVPRRMRVAPAANRRMVEALSQDVLAAVEGTSIRPKNAAARVWGCMAAVGQDERSAGDPRRMLSALPGRGL
ncbi:unnamed protein product [Scytosiphon promiscuus]